MHNDDNEQEIVLLQEMPTKKQSKKRNSKRQSNVLSWTSTLSRSISSRIKRKSRKPPKLQRLQSTLDSNKLCQNELGLKANLYWHIGTPIKRFKVEGQVPIKLILQLVKTFCLIVQVRDSHAYVESKYT